jgi:hypothetical protein
LIFEVEKGFWSNLPLPHRIGANFCYLGVWRFTIGWDQKLFHASLAAFPTPSYATLFGSPKRIPSHFLC